MTATVRRNIRACLNGDPDAMELGLAAADYAAGSRPEAEDVLDSLGLRETAMRALLAGADLKAVGARGPYGNAAQRAAWAAGSLRAAIRAIVMATDLKRERMATAQTIAELTRKLEATRIELRAAKRYANADNLVPYRDPASINRGRVPWATA